MENEVDYKAAYEYWEKKYEEAKEELEHNENYIKSLEQEAEGLRGEIRGLKYAISKGAMGETWQS